MNEPDIPAMRAQHAELERKLAAATLSAAEAYAALLGSDEVDQLMQALSASAEPLDDVTRGRIAMFGKMRSDLVKLAKADVERMRKLVEPAQA